MRYTVAAAEVFRARAKLDAGETMLEVLEDFVDRIPEPAKPSPIKWIEIGSIRYNVNIVKFYDAEGRPKGDE